MHSKLATSQALCLANFNFFVFLTLTHMFNIFHNPVKIDHEINFLFILFSKKKLVFSFLTTEKIHFFPKWIKKEWETTKKKRREKKRGFIKKKDRNKTKKCPHDECRALFSKKYTQFLFRLYTEFLTTTLPLFTFSFTK